MKLIANKNFSMNGVFYNYGDEVKVETKNQLIVLNEQGFIGPLSMKDIQNFGKEENKEVKKVETKPKKEYKRIVEEEE